MIQYGDKIPGTTLAALAAIFAGLSSAAGATIFVGGYGIYSVYSWWNTRQGENQRNKDAADAEQAHSIVNYGTFRQ